LKKQFEEDKEQLHKIYHGRIDLADLPAFEDARHYYT
jgi:hypothetical protein